MRTYGYLAIAKSRRGKIVIVRKLFNYDYKGADCIAQQTTDRKPIHRWAKITAVVPAQAILGSKYSPCQLIDSLWLRVKGFIILVKAQIGTVSTIIEFC